MNNKSYTGAWIRVDTESSSRIRPYDFGHGFMRGRWRHTQGVTSFDNDPQGPSISGSYNPCALTQDSEYAAGFQPDGHFKVHAEVSEPSLSGLRTLTVVAEYRHFETEQFTRTHGFTEVMKSFSESRRREFHCGQDDRIINGIISGSVITSKLTFDTHYSLPSEKENLTAKDIEDFEKSVAFELFVGDGKSDREFAGKIVRYILRRTDRLTEKFEKAHGFGLRSSGISQNGNFKSNQKFFDVVEAAAKIRSSNLSLPVFYIHTVPMPTN